MAGMTAFEGELAHLLPAGGQVAILLDVGAMDVGRAGTLVNAANGVGVLAVLDEIDLATIVPLLKAGVIGCVPADSPNADLARALVAVGRGEIALPSSIAARALAELARPAAVDRRPTDELSERERDVVRLLVRGQTNKDMAQALFLSVRTVEAHLRSIYAKLGVRSRTEAVLWAVRQSPDEGGRE
ncbi:MAG: response regulator transcription factor [Chloroflexi bacterium]|nr:response regulator transcription factor [Chloroflexota bacterium]